MQRIYLAAVCVVVSACAGLPGVSMTKYNALATGMTYAQCVAVIGFEGKEGSRVGSGEFETVSYTWSGSDFKAIIGVFQGGKLSGKSQIGL